VIIKTSEPPDPLSNVVEFTRKKREPSIEIKPAPCDACRHLQVYVDEEKRLVVCRKCKTIIDAFQFLVEMAHQERRWLNDLEGWEAMRDARLSERYDAEWMRHIDDIIEPPTDPQLLVIWNTFHSVLGDKFCAMYKRKKRKTKGPLWYGRDTRGCTISLEYARHQLTPKIVKPNV